MKQNEKILVYAVTGFLVVILGVAVVFGKDGKPTAPEPKNNESTKSLTQLLEQDGLIKNDKAGPVDASSAGNTGVPQPSDITKGPGKPLNAPPPPTAADELRLALGPSHRDRDYRIVKCRRGDTLGKLVDTWCGSIDQLDVAKGLNERWESLKPGEDVVLPWVEDERVLAAWRTDHPLADSSVGEALANAKVGDAEKPKADVKSDKSDKSDKTGSKTEKKAEPVAKGTRVYKLKAGESLWKVAEREVGRGGASAFIEQVKELNPKINSFDKLREGTELRIPGKP
jgi:LysM repeat protein